MKLVKKDESLKVKNAFDIYQRNNKIKKLSEMTLDFKERNFFDFSKFIDVNELKIKDVNLDLVEDYIEILLDKEQKATTINIKPRDLKTFLSYCFDNNYCNSFKITMLKEDEVIKETYSDEQLKILLKKPDLRKVTFNEYRNFVAECFLLANGIRCNSLLNIKINV